MSGAPATETWLPPTAAAHAAGVSPRTVFRWAAAGKVPLRTEHGTRLVELGAVRALAARPRGDRGSRGSAITLAGRPPPTADAFDALVHRVERLERTLPLPPAAPHAPGVPGGPGTHAPAERARGPA
jgi:hypothetical protein